MFLYLFDRTDRLGSNLTYYIAQILYAHNNNLIIKFYKSKECYKFYNSIFVKTLFNYIDAYNEKLYKMNIVDDVWIIYNNNDDWSQMTGLSLQNIQTDLITYFHSNL